MNACIFNGASFNGAFKISIVIKHFNSVVFYSKVTRKYHKLLAFIIIILVFRRKLEDLQFFFCTILSYYAYYAKIAYY